MADIPGLIEGAHEGQGLGDRFLGHVERCAVLLHLVDGTQDDVKTAYTTIRNELAAYSEELVEKPEVLVLNKIDALPPEAIKEKVKVLKRASKGEVLTASGATGINVPEVLWKLIDVIDADKAERAELERRTDQPGWVP
jgi:GTP-binding protein